jgi:hypothetical protein
VKELPQGDHAFRHVVKMVGVCLEGTREYVEYALNERTVSETCGGIGSTTTAEFKPEDSRTRLASG